MRHLLKRHLLPIRAHFRDCLVVTYAFPRDLLEPLLPPGLTLDTHGEMGFVAVALVQTEKLRPAFLPPAMGLDFFLAGYRIFTRFHTGAGRDLRGLLILRSDTDRTAMVRAGNLFTHYGYRKAGVRWEEGANSLEVEVRTPGAEADFHVVADLTRDAVAPPPGSPFATLREARRFAGPLPFTFDYERESGSILIVQGVRTRWNPRPVPVHVHRATFFCRPPFCDAAPVLAQAVYLHDIPNLWRRGVLERIPDRAR